MILFLFIAAFAFGGQWIIDTGLNKLPENFKEKVSQANGTLVVTMDEPGIAVAEFSTESDARSLQTYGWKVMPDIELNWLPENETMLGVESTMEHIGSDEPYYRYQWHLPLIEADKAWDLGVKGQGARVAVLDSGIWYPHPDLANRIDHASSASFVPGTTYMDDNWHGTHVAGIIAAADNGRGVIGVAPEATLIAVKVMNKNGAGNASWACSGIIHAVNVGADVINLSIGGYLKKNGNPPYYTASDAAAVHTLYNRVVNWAYGKGVLVVCAAGNESFDYDASGTIIHLPAEAGAAIAISATGPYGLQDFDRPAHYTNFGKSAIWVAAPGGDSIFPGPTWMYDMILSDSIGGYSFASGTSQAAPVVCGIAALIISKYGKLTPGELKNRIAQAALDLGKKGRDDYYGRGRVNAYNAVK